MADTPEKKPDALWIESVYRPGYKVARSTLKTLGRILNGPAADAAAPPVAEPTAPGENAVALTQVPALNEVGGVAKVETPDHTTIGVARVGRTSFVGFRLDHEQLAEVEVQFDEANGTLRISGEATPPEPPAA